MITWDGRRFDYDLLVVAVGAPTTTAVPGSVSIQGPAYTSRFRTVLRKLDKQAVTRVAFAVPAGTSWPLPLYEFALLTATHVAERGLRKVPLQLVTHGRSRSSLRAGGLRRGEGAARAARHRDDHEPGAGRGARASS